MFLICSINPQSRTRVNRLPKFLRQAQMVKSNPGLRLSDKPKNAKPLTSLQPARLYSAACLTGLPLGSSASSISPPPPYCQLKDSSKNILFRLPDSFQSFFANSSNSASRASLKTTNLTIKSIRFLLNPYLISHFSSAKG